MSRKNELLKLVNVFHSQAKRAQTDTVKWALRKMGDEYQREAEAVASEPISINAYKEKMRHAPTSKEGRQLRRAAHD